MAERPRTSPTTISPNPDDATGYRRGAGTRRGGSGGGRMIGVNLILAVLVAGLVIAGWFIANQHQLLGKEQLAAADASERIKRLENRLGATETAMTGSGQDTQEQIKFWDTEIRKLWTIANERNKKWIKDNERALGKQRGTIQALETNNRDLKAAVGRHEAAFDQQQAIIDQLTSVEMQLQQLIKAQRELVDKVNTSRQTMASLQAGLVNRVKDNEQAVAAIDAYRLQLNNRLANIERRMDRLSVNPTL